MLVGSCTGFVANRMLANYSSEVLSFSIRLPILIYRLTIQQAKNTSNYRSIRQRAVAQLVKCLTWVRRLMVQASQITCYHWGSHCVVSSRHFIHCLVLVIPTKTHSHLTEKRVDCDVQNQIKQTNISTLEGPYIRLLLWIFYVFSVFCLLYLCERLFICALRSPAGKGLTSWLSFVVSNCKFVTFPLVSCVRCGT